MFNFNVKVKIFHGISCIKIGVGFVITTTKLRGFSVSWTNLWHEKCITALALVKSLQAGLQVWFTNFYVFKKNYWTQFFYFASEISMEFLWHANFCVHAQVTRVTSCLHSCSMRDQLPAFMLDEWPVASLTCIDMKKGEQIHWRAQIDWNINCYGVWVWLELIEI